MDVTLDPNDSNIIDLLRDEPERAWSLFLEKYASRIYGLFRHWGLEHNEAGSCFTSLCEHLAQDDFRVLRDASDLASKGNLFPWLRTLARSFALDWAASPAGLEKVVAAASGLGEFQQTIFDLYFLEGCTPPEMRKKLQSSTRHNLLFIEVLEQLEVVLQSLAQEPLWRLLSQLARDRRARREKTSSDLASREVSGEKEQLAERDKKEFERLWQAWAALDSRTALTLQLRYDDCQSIPQIALMIGSGDEQVEGSIRSGLLRLRRSTTDQ